MGREMSDNGLLTAMMGAVGLVAFVALSRMHEADRFSWEHDRKELRDDAKELRETLREREKEFAAERAAYIEKLTGAVVPGAVPAPESEPRDYGDEAEWKIEQGRRGMVEP
jgi:hypothetical protein